MTVLVPFIVLIVASGLMKSFNKISFYVTKAFLVIALLIAGNRATAAPVPVPNGSFEIVGNPAENWSIIDAESSKSTFSLQEGVAHDGLKALHVIKTNRAGYVVLQSAKIPIVEKNTLEISAWLNSKAVSQAKFFFMASQYKEGSDEVDLPNLFGTMRPIYSTNGQWEKYTFQITPRAGIDRIQIRLVFEGSPIDVLVDNVQLTDLSDDKPRYELPTPETLMSRAEAEKLLQARTRATAQVRLVGQRSRLFIDGKENPVAFYVGNAWKSDEVQIGDFKQAGVRVYLIPVMLGAGIINSSYGKFGLWLDKDKTDFSELDEKMWRVLRADPNGYIMFYLNTDPYAEWGAENPDDVATNQNGEKAIVNIHTLRWGGEPKKQSESYYTERYGHSLLSSKLRTDTAKVLSALDQYVKNSLPGKAVIGYHLVGGDDGQTMHWADFDSKHLDDYSPAAQQSFRDWLRVKYKTDANLAAAWQNSTVSFLTATIPSANRRQADKFFLDLQTEQDIIDYNRFRGEGLVDTLNTYAKALRQSHQTPIILGIYYAGPNGLVASHYANEYLFKNNLFDYVTSVPFYGVNRLPGSPGKVHQAWESLLLHGKIGLTENDFRSWKTLPGTPASNLYVARVETAGQSNAMIRRDSGHMLAHGQGNWWYDMWGGWFNDASIMRAVKESVDAYKKDLQHNDFPRADVAVFIDETSLDYLSQKTATNFRGWGLSSQILELNSSGVPYHIYLQSDISNTKIPDYKLYVFLNAYHLKVDDWQAIQKLRRDGKTICFIHAPGVASQKMLDAFSPAAAIEKVTGITVLDNSKQNVAIEPSPHTPLKFVDVISYGNFTAPTFAVDDARAQVIANYKVGGKPSVAIRDFDTWKSVFFGGVGLNAFFFNSLAREAGAWVAAPAGNVVYANQHFLTIHALYPGERNVHLLQPAKVTDLADGEVLTSRTQALQLNMQRGETRWFYLE
jgi:hypothetical protein